MNAGDGSREAVSDLEAGTVDAQPWETPLLAARDPRAHPATLLLPLVLLIVGGLAFAHREEVRTHLMALRAWSDAQGTRGVAIFGLAYAAGVVLFIPGNIMTGVAVALYGPASTIPLVSVAGTVGATGAFLVSRYCVRSHVALRLAQSRRFLWLEAHTAEKGALFVAIARVLPVLPGNLLHYAFGVTRVPLGTFVFWSWLASLPGLVLFVTGLTTVLQWSMGAAISSATLATLLLIILVKVALIAWAAREAGVPLRRSAARER